MEIKIQLAKKGQARDCLSCVKHSELWEAYFKSNSTAENDIEVMISKKQIYLALNKNNECIGFMGVIHNGCFRKFSYLSIIAVESNSRNNGVGKKLIKKYEETGFKQADRVFLLVSDFNKKAQLLYKKLGYKQVGKIPDLFKKGVSENLFVKYKI
ncbi:MAG: GNAT family N-acetyltransferase [Deltaproteobacteria bacterium]|nr:GNAT family N-acetyltransferase [Deltaproteobacteria bacterium]